MDDGRQCGGSEGSWNKQKITRKSQVNNTTVA